MLISRLPTSLTHPPHSDIQTDPLPPTTSSQMTSTFDSTSPTTISTSTISTGTISTIVLALVSVILISVIVAIGICLVVHKRKSLLVDTDHIYEVPGGAANPRVLMSSLSSSGLAPDVMTQNSAYGTSASADATDSKVPDVMTQNSAYGTSASASADIDATDS